MYGAVSAEESERARANTTPDEPGVQGYSGRYPWGWQRDTAYEHNRRLQARRDRQLIYEKAMRVSYAAARGFEAILDTNLTATVVVKEREGVSEEAAEALAENFGLGDYEGRGKCAQGPDALIRMGTLSLMFGYAVLAEGVAFDEGRYWIDGLHWRHTDSISAWLLDERERLVGIEQTAAGFHRTVMDANRVTLLTRLPELGSFEGVALLRPAVKHIDALTAIYQQEQVSRMRYATATPVAIFLPDVAQQYGIHTKEAVEAEIAAFDTILSKMVAHEKARLICPPWFRLEWWGGSTRTHDPDPFYKGATHHERGILEGLGHGYLTAGRSDSAGTFGANVALQRSGSLAATNQLKFIFAALNRQVVARFLDYNFPTLKPEERPSLGFEGLDVGIYIERAQQIREAVESGQLTWQRVDEVKFRAAYDLDPLEDETETPSQFDRARIREATTQAGQRAIRERRNPADIIQEGRGEQADA